MELPWNKANDYFASLSSRLAAEPRSNSTPAFITRLLESNHPVVAATEPYLETLGKQVRISSCQVATGWTRMALGDGTGERIFAISLGYAVIGLFIALYLNVFTVGTVKSAGRAVRSAVRQQLLVVKVSPQIDIHFSGLKCLSGSNLHHYRIGFIPVGMWHQPRLMFHLAISRSESPVANCILPICTVDRYFLSLGCGHNVHVGRALVFDMRY